MTEEFDFKAALKAIQSGQSIEGKDGVLAPLIKQLTEAVLAGELESQSSSIGMILVVCINEKRLMKIMTQL